jgi:hypothetical protein
MTIEGSVVMDYQMTKHGKLVVTIDGSETAWENAKTSANGNNVLTSAATRKP